MNKIVDYKLVESYSPYDLTSAVTLEISVGWTPYHAPQIVVDPIITFSYQTFSFLGNTINVNLPNNQHSTVKYCQAMVRYE